MSCAPGELAWRSAPARMRSDTRQTHGQSKQARDPALLVHVDLLRGRMLGQAGHGHDVTSPHYSRTDP